MYCIQPHLQFIMIFPGFLLAFVHPMHNKRNCGLSFLLHIVNILLDGIFLFAVFLCILWSIFALDMVLHLFSFVEILQMNK